MKECTLTLQTRQKWIHGGRPSRVGGVVVANGQHADFCSWPFGVVERVVACSDGTARTFCFRTADTMLSLVRCTYVMEGKERSEWYDSFQKREVSELETPRMSIFLTPQA